jgi:hypothetical protein
MVPPVAPFGKNMNIAIKTITGKVVELQVQPWDTILQVKPA